MDNYQIKNSLEISFPPAVQVSAANGICENPLNPARLQAGLRESRI